MAHPTIDILQSPDPDCPNPVYNCVKYCFKANDFQTQVGTKAQFTIESTADSCWISGSQTFEVSGQVYTTTDVNSYNTLDADCPLTKEDFITNMIAALNANSHIYGLYDIVQTSPTLLTATAREVGIIEDFVFDLSNLATVNQTDTQGTEDTYQENYRLVIEIWALDFLSPVFVPKKISSEAYTPDENGEFCINIGEKVSSLLESRFVYDQNLASVFFDDNSISKNIYIRYGEIYSEAIGECEVVPRNFETSELVPIINSAFQRGEDVDKIANMCAHQWMTNAPQFTLVSECSEFVLWVFLGDLLPPLPAPPTVETKYIITYTDGTTDTSTTAVLHTPSNSNQVKAIPAGATILSFFTNPAKIVDYYEVQIIETVGAPPTVLASQFFKRTNSCCSNDVEFYFLNEYGGRDAILFTQVDSIELEQSNAVFESFLDCEDPNAIGKSKSTINQTSNDVFEVVSKFAIDYQDRRWIREFITSPQKAVKTAIQGEEPILSNIIVLSGSAQYFKKDEQVFLRLQYILNENINLQKN